MAMACSRCEAWLLLLVFLLLAAARTQGEEKTMAVQNKADNSSSSPSSAPSPAGASNKQSSEGKEKGCVTTKDCHMKRLVCAKKCTLDAHRKCAAKCSRACSSYPICSSLPFP